ncbi:hypothetical protein DITRI_Ditri08aG0114300 [Diplodiscus trichospermus]
MMMKFNVKIKVEEDQEEPTPMRGESSVDEEGNGHLPISQLFRLLQQRQRQSLHSSSLPMPMAMVFSFHIDKACYRTYEVHGYPHKAARCKRKRPRDKNSINHFVKALRDVKRKEEKDWANSSVIKRAEEVQANLSDEFPSFFKIMIPSIVFRVFWMSLPRKFCQLNLPSHDTTVILVDESGKEYIINFLAQRRALSGGWKNFSKEHGLLVGDALVFQLIRPSTFKVYIVRVNGLAEVDAALGLLGLKSSAKQTGIRKNTSEPFSQDTNQNEVHRKNLSYLRDGENQSENDSLDIGSSEVEGIRSSPEVNAEFKQLRGTEKFTILVNGLALDSKLYAIEASDISTPQADFLAWDNTLSGLELSGMDVGFLSSRVQRLLSLAFELKTELKSRRCKEAKLERVNAEEEARSLELELLEKKEEMHRLDVEIEALKVNASRHKLMFEAAAKAPW